MAVISFNFTSLNAELTNPARGKIKIANNISLTNVKEADINLAQTSKAGVKIEFEYKSVYGPEIGQVLIKGHVVYLQESDKVKEVMEAWKKDHVIPVPVAKEVMSAILDKTNIQALIMSRDVGLPSPVPLPKVGTGTETKAKEEKPAK